MIPIPDDFDSLTKVHTYTYTCELKSLWGLYIDGTYISSINATTNYNCSDVNNKVNAFSFGATHNFSTLMPTEQALSRSGYTIHSIRLYNKKIFQNEIEHNAKLDQRYYGD